MKHSLLLVGVIAALAVGAPAYSQYIYMDVNGDGVCTSADVLTTASTGVDVWLDTSHDKLGNTVACGIPSKQLSFASYDVMIGTDPGSLGSVSFSLWTNAVTGFAVLNDLVTLGGAMDVVYTAPSGALAPGLYKLGRASVSVVGNPTLLFLQDPPFPVFPSSVTGFGSECDAGFFGNTVALGYDFPGNCGTASGTPVRSTTWGAIKNLYH